MKKDDTKLCPKSVSRCEQCRVASNTSDKVIIKSVGVRERTDKSGKIVKYIGNIYLHYLTNCLKEYDQNFAFNAINVPLTCPPTKRKQGDPYSQGTPRGALRS